jgi:peptide/nickel transport system permease protein
VVLLALREEDYSLALSSRCQPTAYHLSPSSARLHQPSIVTDPGSSGFDSGRDNAQLLGLGMQPPAVDWGVLLQDAQDMVVVAQQPWRLIPGLFVVIAVLLFNFVGDGLRDAADPYTN